MDYIYVESEKIGRDYLNYKAEIDEEKERMDTKRAGGLETGRTVETARKHAPNETLLPSTELLSALRVTGGNPREGSRRPAAQQELTAL